MKRLLAVVCAFHRVILVVSTVAVGVFASRVASDPTESSSWIFLLAAAVLLFVSDAARQVDENGRSLFQATGVPLSRTRIDVMSWWSFWTVVSGLIFSALCVLSGIFMLPL